ncbi:MAG: phospho-N-acetylmuramoyl-pentapeptide-transferase, partial [Synechococcus sp. MED-G133]
MTDVSNRPRPWWENGTVSASLLTLVVLASSLASDKWLPNSQLTLPLLISTSVAAFVAALGIPRLKALRMGQVIRDEGPQAHQSKAGTP